MRRFNVEYSSNGYLLAIERFKAELRKIINENSKKLGGDTNGERTDV